MAKANRLRKAWRVHVRDGGSETVYAPTKGKAMASAFRSLSDAWDITFKDFLRIASCYRSPEGDVLLPERHPLASKISSEILHCVVHAYGGTGLKAGYRDHFYTSESDHVMKAAYYHGLFNRYRVDKRMSGQPDAVMYELTLLGKAVARGEAETYPGGY